MRVNVCIGVYIRGCMYVEVCLYECALFVFEVCNVYGVCECARVQCVKYVQYKSVYKSVYRCVCIRV